ncbi:MAG: UvrD-helicase domain-containing protein [Paludibacteraceae bacterium]|nr:UvrD-helicase domain-containing protein [Paludibacteraceae bacterium]
MEEILKQLNDNQKEAVLYNDGPSLVVAGAGSGKTRVLTYKIAALLKQGYLPYHILAITFTNKAANEMKNRIAKIVGDQAARQLWMGTFHSTFSRILRIEGSVLGFTKDFTIYDTDSSKSKIKEIIKELNLNDKDYTSKKVLARISKLKNDLVTPNAYDKRFDLQETDRYQNIPRLKEIYRIYMNQCHRANAMDFDDILLYTNILFRDFPDILQKYQNQFQFVLVDEYQDTNFSQHLIVKKLVESHHKLCVVGDDAQSIYSFRGANIENILRFKDNYPEYKLFKLEQNYRSTPNIVDAANSLIAKNKGQIKKHIFSEKNTGSKIKAYSSFSDQEESNIVGNLIKQLSKDYEFQDFAVLYRTNAQSRLLEEALRKRSIPYKIHGGKSFYQRKVVKDILTYLRLIINHKDEDAFKRAIKYPRKGIGDTTIEKINELANKLNTPYWDIISDPVGYKLDLGAAAIKKLNTFRTQIEEFSSIASTTDAYSLTDRVVKEFGILVELGKDTSPEGKDDLKLAEEVLSGIHEFCESQREEYGVEISTISDYLQTISLLTDQDTDKAEDINKVTLMTVHAAKGLEFKNVIIVGLEEELFPSDMNLDTDAGIEEERRLFYVAITRAEENCIITYAKSRFRNGRTLYTSPSRFLSDIESQYIDLPVDFHDRNTRANDEFDFNKLRNYGSSNYGFNSSNKPRYAQTQQSYYNTETRNSSSYSPSSEVKITTPTPSRLKKVVSSPTNDVPTTSTNTGLQVGNKVKHERFGIGTITGIETMNGDYKITINFENSGEKKILQKYTKLEVIS